MKNANDPHAKDTSHGAQAWKRQRLFAFTTNATVACAIGGDGLSIDGTPASLVCPAGRGAAHPDAADSVRTIWIHDHQMNVAREPG